MNLCNSCSRTSLRIYLNPLKTCKLGLCALCGLTDPCVKLVTDHDCRRLAAPAIKNQQESSMSGHSKWSKVKHVKAVVDAKKGRAFTKVIKEITVAARIGGGDPNGNPRLRAAVQAAKQINMPADNVKRAIMKGTGELPGVSYEEVTYEGYGPGGVALLVEVMTDNKNRTVSEMRFVFSRNNGNMAEAGSVSWMFHKKGSIVVDKTAVTEEQLMELALDAGAEDITEDSGNFEILTPTDAFEKVTTALHNANIA